ncbi:hypothetical protein CRUP_036843 [Coryphaenoides rupestris]|nr:hypothetical protein CRUP_036843 [Coryphaenoides rupestris]
MNTTSGCMSSMPLGYKPSPGPYIAAELIIALVAIVGNLLVCLAVSRNRRLRTVTNYFLVRSGRVYRNPPRLADFLVGLVAIPCAVLTDLGRPHHDLPLCLVLLSILMVLTQWGRSLLAVALERYVAILRPFHYQRVMSPRNARLALVVTWSLALVSGSVPLMDLQRQNQDSSYCLFTCVVGMTYMVYFNFFGFLLIPLLSMFIIYSHIFYTVRHQLRRIAVARGMPSEASRSAAAVSDARDVDTREIETPSDVKEDEEGALTRGSKTSTNSGTGGVAVGGCGTTQRGEEGEGEVAVSSRGPTQVCSGDGKRVRVGASVEEPDGAAATTGAVDGASSRGSVGKTIPGLEAHHEAAGGIPGPDPGDPAETEAVEETGSGVRISRPVIQTKTTAVFRKISTRSTTQTSGSGSDDRCSGLAGGPAAVESSKPCAARARLEARKATSLFLVLFLFMVCWMPINLINCILLLRPQCPVPMPVTLAAILLSHANSALNPLLYAYRMRSFRHTLRAMCAWTISPPKRH